MSRLGFIRKIIIPLMSYAVGPDCEAKFEIETLKCSFSRGFSLRDLKRIQDHLEGQQDYLMEVWNEYQED